MKKAISLLLALVMCLSLCACGGSNDTTETTENNETQVTTEVTETEPIPENVELTVGVTHSFEKFDITIIGIEYTDEFDTRVEGLWNLGAKDGNVFFNIYYNIKYNDKQKAFTTDFLPNELDFDDGYLYGLGNYFFYNPSDNAWHQISETIDGMSPQLTYVAAGQVPEVVMNEKDKSLVVNFSILGENFSYTPRPSTAEGKEAMYTYSMNLLNSDNRDDVSIARGLLFELGDYKNSALTTRIQCFTYDDREFFKEYVQNLTPMTEDEIRTVLSGNTFSMRNNYGSDNNGLHTISFHENGSLDAGYTYKGEQYTMYDKWRIENGTVIVVTPDGTEKALTPYQYDETRYLLIELGKWGDSSMVLTVGE